LKVLTGNINLAEVHSLRFVGIFVLLLFFATPALSQNTKGDRPSRDTRFKTQKKDRKGLGFSSKRVRTKGRSASSSGAQYTPRGRSRGGERAGRPLRPNFNVKEPSDKQRAWKGDLTGRRIRGKNKSSTKPYVHSQRGTHVRRIVPDREGRQNVTGGRPVRIPSATGKTKNVFPQRGKFVSNPSTKPRETQRAVSNRAQLARVKTLETKKPPPGKKVRVVPRTASRPFIRNKSINIYANFKRPKKKGELATTKDLAGRKIRTKNYQTPSVKVIKAPRVNTGRRHFGDRAYKGPLGSYKSISDRAGKAWVGDISKRNIRSRTGKQGTSGPAIFSRNRSATRTGRVGVGGGYRSATRHGEKRVGAPIPVKAPGIGASGIGNYRGNRRGVKGFLNQGEHFTGYLKARKRAQGGGSVSGRRWNNNGVAIPTKTGKVNTSGFPGKMKLFQNRPGFSNQGESYTGALKRKRPAKGGGSVSGKLWNNDGSSIPSKTGKVNTSGIPVKMKLFQARPGFSDQGEEYSGAIKSRRPAKGGGSVSGKLWNNDGTPIPGKPRSERGLNFSGNIKAKRPVKGGGSVSGKLWNNDETPIPSKTYPSDAKKIEGFPVKMKRFEAQPGFNDQGEEFTGYIRLSRLRRNYVQNPNASDESLKKRRPEKGAFDVDGLQVKVKRREYVRNKNASEDALMKLKTTETDKRVAGLQVRVQRRPYVRNKNADDESLYKLKPTRTDREVAGLQVKVRQYNYRENPNSAEGALKVREPGKAFARATDYQGNIRMQKFQLFERNRERHPDARFVRTNKNNVANERDTLTNLKLWWARLFKKQENQPDHLKEKLKKPRYDKGEQGLWYD
jgi:hypothetical protein